MSPVTAILAGVYVKSNVHFVQHWSDFYILTALAIILIAALIWGMCRNADDADKT